MAVNKLPRLKNLRLVGSSLREDVTSMGEIARLHDEKKKKKKKKKKDIYIYIYLSLIHI